MSEGIAERIEAVRWRMAAACERAGRDPAGVALVAVSKGFGPEEVAAAAACGVEVFGENRVQEAAQKIPLCPGRLEWHMVGHLQRNKARPAVGLFRAIHAVDSWRLLEALNAACEEAGCSRLPVLLEVNVAGESSKFGLAPGEVAEVVERSAQLARLEVRGLMTIPPFRPDPEEARPFFRRLRELRDACRERTGAPLDDLSMGMSADLEVAIEEGATWVRVGTAIFGARTRKQWSASEGGDE